MKTKSIKKIANDGVRVKYTIHLFKSSVVEESVAMVRSLHLVPTEKVDYYLKINKSFPMYYPVRITENYTLFAAQSQAFKASTLKNINEIVKELSNE